CRISRWTATTAASSNRLSCRGRRRPGDVRSPEAAMLVTYTHSRAAILCLGGWGLQVMLHLAPRLLGAQEQRAALNAQGPDLQRITSFGAVLADPLLVGGNQAQLHLRRLRPDAVWPPFYVERLLTDIQQKPPAPGEEALATLLTAGERRAVALLRAAEPMMQP